MSKRPQLVCVIAVSFLTSVAVAQGQGMGSTARGTANLLRVAGQPAAAASAFPGQSSSTSYTFAPTPKPQENSQQQGNSSEGQSQNGGQNQGSSANQNPNQAQNQNQNQNTQGQAKGKDEAAPPKPSYLTYTVKKKSLEEQAKTGKTLAVDFKSAPAGASITVDGYFVGNTPTTAQIPIGKHLVSITKWGYESWSQELDVAAGKDLNINPKLKSNW